MNVAILGASEKEQRYSHKAQKLLVEEDHIVFPVSPSGKEILGAQGYSRLTEIKENVDTVTVYVNPARLDKLVDDINEIQPRRVIFNPGSESPRHQKILDSNGIDVIEACTLVLLRTGQFES